MNRTGEQSAAAERSRWLAELAEAIDQAQRLARALRSPASDCAEAREVFQRLESVRFEVDALRRGIWSTRSTEIDPLRTNPFPWNRRQNH